MTTRGATVGRTRIEPVSGRDRLLDEATALFVSRGYAAVSMHEIAEAAGMTKAAPYYHFKDKEDLFVQVFAREQMRLEEELSELIERGGEFGEVLERLLTRIFAESSLSFGQLLQDLRRYVSEERIEELFGLKAFREGAIDRVFADAAGNEVFAGISAADARVLFISLLIGYFDLAGHNRQAKTPLPGFHELPVATIARFFLRGVS
jgi:AcrR family transcriptional regulator